MVEKEGRRMRLGLSDEHQPVSKKVKWRDDDYRHYGLVWKVN